MKLKKPGPNFFCSLLCKGAFLNSGTPTPVQISSSSEQFLVSVLGQIKVIPGDGVLLHSELGLLFSSPSKSSARSRDILVFFIFSLVPSTVFKSGVHNI